MSTTLSNTAADLAWFLDRARPSLRRSMRRFAEEEIVIPDGPFEGRKFSCARQPYTGLWFDAVDSGLWPRCVATGPTQSGKTLASFVIPLLYHLFEIGETTICGLPDMDMAADKWREDILPAIERSRYRDLLPTRGGGSRGGRVESIQFLNGATLKFMSGGGGDKSRAGFTSRVVVITETDGMDEAGLRSRESDKITQLEARTRAYGSRKRIYMECTVSTEQGRTWIEYQHGTRSRIVLPCPHCGQWVAPEREHLIGWQSAANQVEARRSGAFACPSCGQLWNEEDRTRANQRGRLLHGDQTIGEDDAVTGDPPATDTLGFRWSAVHNMFLTAGDIAADEWRASHSPDEENAEREMRQFVWCIPVAPAKWDETALDGYELASRVLGRAARRGARGRAEADHGDRLGQAPLPLGAGGLERRGARTRRGLWTRRGSQPGVRRRAGAPALAPRTARPDPGGLAPPRCRGPTLRARRGLDRRGLHDRRRVPVLPRVPPGRQCAAASCPPWDAGPGSSGSNGTTARPPPARWSSTSARATTSTGWPPRRCISSRSTPITGRRGSTSGWRRRSSNPGAMTLYQAAPQEHLSLAKHLTAETKTEEFVAGKGVVVRWERVRKPNHWFDALYNACAAGHFCGVRLLGESPPQPRPPRTLQQMYDEAHQVRRPDGSPWLWWQR